jgi:hypothetical protein
MNSGLHSILFDGTMLKPGIYFYALGTLGNYITQRMILIR